jgi:bifunctional non-homologous end joining protein LigD
VSVSRFHRALTAAGLRKFHGDADRGSVRSSLPTWVNPQLAALVKTAPDGPDWLHEIKLNGYRMHARRDAGRAKILTRRGNDWTEKCPSIAKALTSLQAD